MNALDVAEAAVAAVSEGEALAHVSCERSLLLRFAGNRPTQATAIDDLTVELAVLLDGHLGRAATNAADRRSLDDCAARAVLAARAAAATAPEDPYPGFPVPGPAQGHHGHDPATAALDPARGGDALYETFDVAREHGVEAHGVWTAAEDERAVATRAAGTIERTTDAAMKVICIAPSGRSGFASAVGVAEGEISGTGVAEQAARKAMSAEPVVELPPGEYPVVMEPRAVSSLLDLLGETALDGRAFAEGQGAWVGHLGESVAASTVSLLDAPYSPRTLPRAFDAEGTPKRELPLIEAGVARNVVHDRHSAALADAESTGHAVAPGGDPEGPRPHNLVLAAGSVLSMEELCAPIERGVYVTRLWYENVVRPKETLVTAVTRDGTFLIEDGRIARPLRDLRLTDSVLGILSRVEDLTLDQVLTSEAEFYGRRFAYGTVSPGLRATAARFTGATG
jgi:predicted Zn-dependent protease